MPKSLHPTVPVIAVKNNGITQYRIYGQRFETQDLAVAFGLEHQATLEKAANRPLSPRERISGRLAEADVQAAESAAAPVVETNPYRRRIAELERRPGHSPQDRAEKQRLIKRFMALAAEFESKGREAENVKRHSERDDVQRLRSHARRTLAEAETPEEKERAQSLYTLAHQPFISRGAYWDAVKNSGGVVMLNDDATDNPANSS